MIVFHNYYRPRDGLNRSRYNVDSFFLKGTQINNKRPTQRRCTDLVDATDMQTRAESEEILRLRAFGSVNALYMLRATVDLRPVYNKVSAPER